MLSYPLLAIFALATSLWASPISKRVPTLCTPNTPTENVKFVYAANTSLNMGTDNCEACTTLGILPIGEGVDYFQIQDAPANPLLKRILSPNYGGQVLTVDFTPNQYPQIFRSPSSPDAQPNQDIFTFECETCDPSGAGTGCSIAVREGYPEMGGQRHCLWTLGIAHKAAIQYEDCSPGQIDQTFNIVLA